MKFYLQSLNPDEFMQINQAVSLAGVCSEPVDFSRGELNVMDTIHNLLEVMSEDQSFYIYGLSSNFRAMLEEGKRLQKLSGQLVLTLPTSEQGLMAAKAARRMQIPVALGSIFSAAQAALAIHDHAGTILLDLNKASRFIPAEEILRDTLALFAEGEKERLLVLCSNMDQFNLAIRLQAASIAAPSEVYAQLLYNVLTSSEMMQAREEWLLAYTRNEVLD